MRKIITLCGSTKFKKEFEEVNARLTLEGNIVISVGVFGHADGVPLTEQQKIRLDNIHLQKIDMADEIFVINVGGYIGESTSYEMRYASKKRKPINFYDLAAEKESFRKQAVEWNNENSTWEQCDRTWDSEG
ncbi:hypothetical protein [Paenibacillus donghaensis]|uniref:hypothetical protein n=1 Tax=Paenibacillus donghaensis TaxID=414771 RepID=UPI001FE66CB9|nr:hypothetical protein [Paenibacillus donghaensis]